MHFIESCRSFDENNKSVLIGFSIEPWEHVANHAEALYDYYEQRILVIFV